MTSTRVLVWLVCAAAACLWLSGRAQGTVSCRTACSQCSARKEHEALLEVYCAMCHECRERRRAWRHFAPRRRKLAPSPRPSQRANSADEFPDESPDEPPIGHPEEPRCPEPPPCDSELLDGTPDTIMGTTPERAPASQTALAPAAAQPCHQHTGCPTAGVTPCCVPMCAYPQPCAQEHLPQKMTMPQSSTAAPTEYFYIHVGVPKEILNNM